MTKDDFLRDLQRLAEWPIKSSNTSAAIRNLNNYITQIDQDQEVDPGVLNTFLHEYIKNFRNDLDFRVFKPTHGKIDKDWEKIKGERAWAKTFINTLSTDLISNIQSPHR